MYECNVCTIMESQLFGYNIYRELNTYNLYNNANRKYWGL